MRIQFVKDAVAPAPLYENGSVVCPICHNKEIATTHTKNYKVLALFNIPLVLTVVFCSIQMAVYKMLGVLSGVKLAESVNAKANYEDYLIAFIVFAIATVLFNLVIVILHKFLNKPKYVCSKCGWAKIYK